MEDNELYQTIEDVNRMNRTIDEMNRFNDPVQRDVIVGDWKRKKPLSKKDQRTSIIILLIFTNSSLHVKPFLHSTNLDNVSLSLIKRLLLVII